MGLTKYISVVLFLFLITIDAAEAERHGSNVSNDNSSNPFSQSIGTFNGSAKMGSPSAGNFDIKPSKQLEDLTNVLSKQLEENQKTADKTIETMRKSAESGQQSLGKVMENAAKDSQASENNKDFKNTIAQITQSLSARDKEDAATSLKLTEDINKSLADRAQAAIENNKKTLEILSGAPNQNSAPLNNGNLLTAADSTRGNPLAQAIKATSGQPNEIPSFGSEAKGTALSHSSGGNTFVNSYNPPTLSK